MDEVYYVNFTLKCDDDAQTKSSAARLGTLFLPLEKGYIRINTNLFLCNDRETWKSETCLPVAYPDVKQMI